MQEKNTTLKNWDRIETNVWFARAQAFALVAIASSIEWDSKERAEVANALHMITRDLFARVETDLQIAKGADQSDAAIINRIADIIENTRISAYRQEYVEPDEGLMMIRDLFIDQADKAELFMVRVWGDSLTGAGINDADTVIVQSSTALLSGELGLYTYAKSDGLVMRYYYHESYLGRIRLEAANPQVPTLFVEPRELRIIGRVLTHFVRWDEAHKELERFNRGGE